MRSEVAAAAATAAGAAATAVAQLYYRSSSFRNACLLACCVMHQLDTQLIALCHANEISRALHSCVVQLCSSIAAVATAATAATAAASTVSLCPVRPLQAAICTASCPLALHFHGNQANCVLI